MKISINSRYILIQGLFWMLFCVGMGYVSVYLLGIGISNSAIGTLVAVFGVLSAVLQPVFGRLSDKRKEFSWKNISIFCAIIFLTVCILMLIVKEKIFSGICMGILILLANLINPFINSALFYYMNKGINIDFGLARGIGSAVYAVLAYIIGGSVARFGIASIPFTGVLVTILFLIVLIGMPYGEKFEKSLIGTESSIKVWRGISKDSETREENKIYCSDVKSGENSVNILLKNYGKMEVETKKGGFIKKYPYFVLMVVGCVFLLTSHNIIATFLPQIIKSFGGNSRNLGLALAIQTIVEIPVLLSFSKLQRMFSSKTLMIITGFGYVLKSTVYFLAGSVVNIYFCQLAQMLSFAIFASASIYYTQEVVRDEDLATGQALMASVAAGGASIGSLIGGYIIDIFSIKALLFVNILISITGLFIVLTSVIKNKDEKRI